jgi:HSP20 family protein
MLLTLNDPFSFVDSFFNPFPNYQVDDCGDSFQINMELPGVKKEDLKMEVNGQRLTITAQRKGHRQGEIKKAFDLPVTVDQEGITASLQDGILSVKLAKVQKAQPRLIKID